MSTFASGSGNGESPSHAHPDDGGDFGPTNIQPQIVHISFLLRKRRVTPPFWLSTVMLYQRTEQFHFVANDFPRRVNRIG